MPKVITFSRVFPKSHPRAGQPTWFVEKIWKSLWDAEKSCMNPLGHYWGLYDEAFPMTTDIETNIHQHKPKHHTIRGGNRWKEGDWFSPLVWSGLPYASKQIQFAPDIQIKKVWNFECNFWNTSSWAKINERELTPREFSGLALNDGLSGADMMSWMRCHPKKNEQWFAGQILCWNENCEY